jgi:CubicO group peptidase (beta-lactamase class C family)
MRITGFLALLLVLAVPAYAQDEAGPTPAEAADLAAKPIPPIDTHGAALTALDVEALSDGLVPTMLRQGDIAGAVVVVVKGGQILFHKGYGFADVKARKPVDPARTLFRPGSVSKLFTWTAVMQLVGAGKLDLDADVNRYIDFTIPPAFGKPVTLRQLMTHTAGFEETLRPLFLGSPSGVEPLGDVLKGALPARIFVPGEVPAYSNYGATLAGYIVQRVSGEKFDDYVQRHIFAPLGMAHATFAQPLPKALAPDMSKGYQLASGPETPFEVISMVPAGGLSASGDDIARFMIAHLHDGAYGNARILSPEMAVRMHGAATHIFPHLLPMAYGFYRDDRNGWTVIEHGGDTGVFHSILSLIPKADVGLFISLNSAGRDVGPLRLRRAYFNSFMDRYFPAASAPVLPTLKTAAEHGNQIAGTYSVSRRGDTNFLRLLYLLQPIGVSVAADGTVMVSPLVDAAGNVKHWREVQPYVWQEVNGDSRLEAVMRDGKVYEIGSDDFGPIVALQPATLSEGLAAFILLAGTAAMLLLTVVFWPIKAILRWRYERPLALTGWPRRVYTLTRLVALVDLAFLASFPLLFVSFSSHLASLSSGIDYAFRAAQLAGLIGVLATPIPMMNFVYALRDPSRVWWTKLTDGLIALAALATLWFAFSLDLLTIGLKY